MNHDPWLERWSAAIVVAAVGGPVLEIGCGSGQDTSALTAMGLEVFAFDLDPVAAAQAALAAPRAHVSTQSVLDRFPLEGKEIGVVLASLSLHYFSWTDTVALIHRIRLTLRTGGLFLVRLNSDQDIHFGATGHREVEPGLFSVNGQAKRFFSALDIERLFTSGWVMKSQRHLSTLKYGQPKALWELALERQA